MKSFLTKENLPLPVVEYPAHYGCFISFREEQDGVPYVCECFKPALINALKLWILPGPFSKSKSKQIKVSESLVLDMTTDLKSYDQIINQFNYRANICHKCNLKTPAHVWCHAQYGGVFRQKFGWYIELLKFEHGIIKGWTKNEFYRYLPEACNASYVATIKEINELHKSFWKFYDSSEISHKENQLKTKQANKLERQLENDIENLTREIFGHKKIGDQWTSETILYELIKNIFPQYRTTIKRHFRPEWLKGLELDVFIEELNIAFEYQGIQHFKAVEHWGGKDSLIDLKKRDKRKARLAKNHGITLVYINYDEPLFEDFIRFKIKEKGISL